MRPCVAVRAGAPDTPLPHLHRDLAPSCQIVRCAARDGLSTPSAARSGSCTSPSRSTTTLTRRRHGRVVRREYARVPPHMRSLLARPHLPTERRTLREYLLGTDCSAAAMVGAAAIVRAERIGADACSARHADSPVACCPLHVACCMLHVACCMSSAACCMLHVVRCMLHVACCMLSAACCMLHVACCPLHVACCALRVLEVRDMPGSAVLRRMVACLSRH
jgi:hypothetical protein